MTNTMRVHISDGSSDNIQIFSKTYMNPEGAIVYGKSLTGSNFEHIVGEKIQHIVYDLTSLYLIFSSDTALQITSFDRKIIANLITAPNFKHLSQRVEIIHRNGECEIFNFSELAASYAGKKFKRIHIDGSIAWVYCQNSQTLLCCSLKSIVETVLPMIYIENEE